MENDMTLKDIVALAATHPTLVVDKGSWNRLVVVRFFKNPTEAALHALEVQRYAPCTCVGCDTGSMCVADEIFGSNEEVIL